MERQHSKINKISVPTFNAFSNGWHREWHPNLLERRRRLGWNARRSQLIWRGSVSSYGDHRERPQLLNLSRTYPDLIDAKDIEGSGREDALPMEEQERYKYTVAVSGSHHAYPWRIPELFLRGFLVVLVTADTEPAFLCELQPNVHFLRVGRRLEGLVEAVRWARSHDEEARRIARQGQLAMRSLYNASRMGDAIAAHLTALPYHASITDECGRRSVKDNHQMDRWTCKEKRATLRWLGPLPWPWRLLRWLRRWLRCKQWLQCWLLR